MFSLRSAASISARGRRVQLRPNRSKTSILPFGYPHGPSGILLEDIISLGFGRLRPCLIETINRGPQHGNLGFQLEYPAVPSVTVARNVLGSDELIHVGFGLMSTAQDLLAGCASRRRQSEQF